MGHSRGTATITLSCCTGCTHSPGGYMPVPTTDTAPSSTALVWSVKKTNQQKSPRRSDPDVSILLLSGRGESSSSPSQSTTQPVGLSHRYMWYGAPGLPLQTPRTAAVPCHVPETWGACPASIPAAGATALLGDQGLGQTLPPLQEALAVQSKPKTRAFQLASRL